MSFTPEEAEIVARKAAALEEKIVAALEGNNAGVALIAFSELAARICARQAKEDPKTLARWFIYSFGQDFRRAIAN